MIEPLTEHEMLSQLTLGKKVNELIEAFNNLQQEFQFHSHETGLTPITSTPRYDV